MAIAALAGSRATHAQSARKIDKIGILGLWPTAEGIPARNARARLQLRRAVRHRGPAEEAETRSSSAFLWTSSLPPGLRSPRSRRIAHHHEPWALAPELNDCLVVSSPHPHYCLRPKPPSKRCPLLGKSDYDIGTTVADASVVRGSSQPSITMRYFSAPAPTFSLLIGGSVPFCSRSHLGACCVQGANTGFRTQEDFP